MTTARDLAYEVLNETAVPAFVRKVEDFEQTHDYMWIFDPDVDNVVGLVKRGTNRAEVVVYLDRKDFEGGESL
ncbi:hypothetical protein [Branchiibius sp. NY16-3462-2]|uniref:hypothetical protein n=1 Tax=Branchiibius sp. NY16-3462-2 TaxID=1807500 RepID=UPI0007967AD1|nr:hypothetical protein [Branchiibius sp. NY16-3462-2]KYH43241.1 hypothetical protein AZH51_12870 [Branchiibius sp. NY16-3462-2]